MSDDTTTETETVKEDGNGNGDAPAAGSGSAPQGSSIDSFPEAAQRIIRETREESAGRRNENKELKDRLKKLEDAGKSEQERKDEALKEAETDRDGLKVKLLRYEVAEKVGLPLKLAGRLQGSDEDALKKDAEALKEEFGITDNGGSGGSGSFDGGVRRGSKKQPASMTELIRAAAGR